jgi:hypothetical protein
MHEMFAMIGNKSKPQIGAVSNRAASKVPDIAVSNSTVEVFRHTEGVDRL